jgi:hypothetical protein
MYPHVKTTAQRCLSTFATTFYGHCAFLAAGRVCTPQLIAQPT